MSNDDDEIIERHFIEACRKASNGPAIMDEDEQIEMTMELAFSLEGAVIEACNTGSKALLVLRMLEFVQAHPELTFDQQCQVWNGAVASVVDAHDLRKH